MKVIILAAGQGIRLRPMTDNMPKCMVEVNSKSIIKRQIEVIKGCGIEEKDIIIVCGYKYDVLKRHLSDTDIKFIYNKNYENTNMVYSFMCAENELKDDIIVSYGDIIYEEKVLKKLLEAKNSISIVLDDGWYNYWSQRSEDPLNDAETLKLDYEDCIVEIGQKTSKIEDIQSQYIGLMRFKDDGIKSVVELCEEAKRRSHEGERLWRTDRRYDKMYMTDMLQGLIDESKKLYSIRINRGWFEIDNADDLAVAELECRS